MASPNNSTRSGGAVSANANKEHASDSELLVQHIEKNTPLLRPRLPDTLRYYSSRLDERQGPLRTTSDGNLVDEESGDWLVLDTPAHHRQDHKIALQPKQKAAKEPAIDLPEAKNGATGLDGPRVRKPLARLIRNKWTRSDRPPVEEEDPVVEEKKKVQAKIAQQQAKQSEKVDMVLLEEIRQFFGPEAAKKLGGDWFEHALVEKAFWWQVLETVSSVDVE